ncbi:Serine protease Do-like HtrA [Thalassoglobus neptunius]|uniref:Serine protease Do-like HtrA n=1 Tax=Thalassoglobus neptunius TaxID=1938619 RepID=A0A5C5WLS5_9PLAN|nr:serine protease [Thalassoglobus neptunius]TWT51744.1 Serine protease Do-like HtrA [Thalassoglobus neptunius]
MRQFTFWMLFCSTIPLCNSPAYSQEAQRFVSAKNQATQNRYLRRAVIKIEDHTENTSGSGFFIREDDQGRKYALTNAHVVDPANDLRVDVYPHGSINVKHGIEVLAEDEARDLALIRFRVEATVAFLPVATRSSRTLRDDRVTIVGFPDGQFTQRNKRVTDQEICSGDYGQNFFYLDSRFGPGGSGSPVIGYDTNNEFQIVGVYQGYTPTKGVACFEIEEFLTKAKYRMLMNGKSPSRQAQTEIHLLLGLLLQEVAED